MKRIFSLSVALMFTFLLFSNHSEAQEWSKEQQDVWAGVEKYWAVAASGDAEAFLTYFDESYVGWNYQSKVPQTKANTAKWIKYGFSKSTSVLYTLTPVAIWVKGDFAYVDYFFAEVEKNNETGKNEPRAGKWTDILMKKDGKWVIIGDHGGQTSKVK